MPHTWHTACSGWGGLWAWVWSWSGWRLPPCRLFRGCCSSCTETWGGLGQDEWAGHKDKQRMTVNTHKSLLFQWFIEDIWPWRNVRITGITGTSFISASAFHLWVLEPHLQPLHSHEPSLFVTTCGREETQQVSGHVVHGLPAVQLIPENIQHVVLHTLCQFIIPATQKWPISPIQKLSQKLPLHQYGTLWYLGMICPSSSGLSFSSAISSSVWLSSSSGVEGWGLLPRRRSRNSILANEGNILR